jgi:CubicO group peptidase (beta-lactamase class C family)
MDSTWLEGHEPARRQQAAHHYSGELDWTEISPTIDWAGGGLVTTAPNLARYVRALWSGQILDSSGLDELTRWTPAASFPPGHTLRYERYGLGMGANTVDGVELLGHTGFIGAFAFHAPACNAVLVGSHNASHVDRWPLVTALCREGRLTEYPAAAAIRSRSARWAIEPANAPVSCHPAAAGGQGRQRDGPSR